MGILKRANIIAKKMRFSDQSNLYLRLKRLLSPDLMGNLFKVLLAQKKDIKFSLIWLVKVESPKFENPLR